MGPLIKAFVGGLTLIILCLGRFSRPALAAVVNFTPSASQNGAPPIAADENGHLLAYL